MATDPVLGARKKVQLGEEALTRGQGGELHQVADGDTPVLTTNQGIPVADDQNSLRLGERGPTLLEDFHFREKLFHFDHERIPERVVHARGYRRARLLRDLRVAERPHSRRPVPAQGREDRGVRAVLDRGRQQGLGGSRPRRARLRGQVLHQGRQLGPGRQQHPGVLHPGRDQVPGSHSRRQARARSRLSAGADRARQFLGFHLADAREHAHDHVDHVGPDHPALVPVHGGLRRPHLPAGQRRRQVDLRQVPLEAQAGHAVGGVERGGEDQRRRPRLPSPRPVGRDPERRLSRVGTRAAAVR